MKLFVYFLVADTSLVGNKVRSLAHRFAALCVRVCVRLHVYLCVCTYSH